MKKTIIAILGFVFLGVAPMRITAAPGPVDIVIFSYNRPLQLFAYLESIQRYCLGVGKIFVLYRASNEKYAASYAKLKHMCNHVEFLEQHNAPKDFKPLVCEILLKKIMSPYVAFGVDDIVVCDAIDLYKCVQAMEATKALGFYLRLGKNITYGYMTGKTFKTPPLVSMGNGTYIWRFSSNIPEWRYAHSLDMTIFRKAYAQEAVVNLSYAAPNRLEAAWGKKVPGSDFGICFEHSKIVNIPLNLVQDIFTNKNMNSFSPEYLLEQFNAGFKMDIDQFAKYENNSPHMHFIPSFKHQLDVNS